MIFHDIDLICSFWDKFPSQIPVCKEAQFLWLLQPSSSTVHYPLFFLQKHNVLDRLGQVRKPPAVVHARGEGTVEARTGGVGGRGGGEPGVTGERLWV